MIITISIVIIFCILIEIRFNPRLEVNCITSELLLFYNVYMFSNTRNYINLKIKIR